MAAWRARPMGGALALLALGLLAAVAVVTLQGRADRTELMKTKPADVFGSSDSGPFYKEDGPRFESYPGGMTWARGRGYTYVATGGLPGTKSEKNTLRAISDGLADSISSADMDNSVCEPDPGLSSRASLLPSVTDADYQRDIQRGVLEKHSEMSDPSS
ncbi:hypothetical protein T484DRAFT_1854132 [Baffinella frigidus]|nr:hypothetical protein T484DRAFT_1854132 [Cryptophyta sp. CCMP2293]